MIRRRFVDLDHGQLHLRECGSGSLPELIMLHPAPGSARVLTPLQLRLAGTRRVVAFDLPGMGDSDPLPSAAPCIADYADAVLAALARLAISRCHLWGTLSGARVVCEIAARDPGRVASFVLDGVGIPRPEDVEDLLRHYAPRFEPDADGSQLLRTFLLCRDQYLFYPWYRRDAEHRRPLGLPAAELLHVKTLEALKSSAGFAPLIAASFAYDFAPRFASTRQPCLASGEVAPLRAGTETLGHPSAEPLTASTENLELRTAEIGAFLARHDR
jgi:pimeloyl-ACP methyl ester carboxylesterase